MSQTVTNPAMRTREMWYRTLLLHELYQLQSFQCSIINMVTSVVSRYQYRVCFISNHRSDFKICLDRQNKEKTKPTYFIIYFQVYLENNYRWYGAVKWTTIVNIPEVNNSWGRQRNDTYLTHSWQIIRRRKHDLWFYWRYIIWQIRREDACFARKRWEG